MYMEERLNEIGAWMNEYYAHDGLRRPEISVPTAIDVDGIETGRNPSGKRQGLFGSAWRRLTGFSSGRSASAIAPQHGLSRLFVASGLSYPDSETGKVSLSSEIPPIPPGTGANYRQKLVSKDDV